MQTVRIVQAVILMSIVALAASCAVSKAYTTKLFAPKTPVAADTASLALRFLDLDNIEKDTANWVTTDITRTKDTAMSMAALDRLAEKLPAKTDSLSRGKTEKTETVTPVPLVRNLAAGQTRTRRTREDGQ